MPRGMRNTPDSVVTSALQAALAALRSRERERALDTLLAAWKVGRHRAIAEAIVELGRELNRSLPPIAGKNTSERHESWMKVCLEERTRDVDRLMAGVLEGNGRLIADRAKELARRPPDPRIVRGFLPLVLASPWTATSTEKNWTAIFATLRAMGDPTIKPEIERAHSAGARLPPLDKVGRLLASLPDASELELAQAATLDEIRAEIATLAGEPPLALSLETASIDAELRLLRDVGADPTDDARRQVLADYWLERSDPRGELMRIQLSKKPSQADKRLERQLLKTPRRLLGELAAVLEPKTIVFERGLLSRCATQFRNKKQRETLLRHPAWITVEQLFTDEPRLVSAEATPALRALTMNRALLEELMRAPAGPPRFTHLTLFEERLLLGPPEELPRLDLSAPVFRGLEHLTLKGSQYGEDPSKIDWVRWAKPGSPELLELATFEPPAIAEWLDWLLTSGRVQRLRFRTNLVQIDIGALPQSSKVRLALTPLANDPAVVERALADVAPHRVEELFVFASPYFQTPGRLDELLHRFPNAVVRPHSVVDDPA